jgi:hypothetical protein
VIGAGAGFDIGMLLGDDLADQISGGVHFYYEQGKPKKISQELDPGKILQAIDNEEMVVEIDGKIIRMPKVEIHFRQLFNKATRGNLKEARLIAKMAAKYFGPEAEAPPGTQFIIVPDKIISLVENQTGGKGKT